MYEKEEDLLYDEIDRYFQCSQRCDFRNKHKDNKDRTYRDLKLQPLNTLSDAWIKSIDQITEGRYEELIIIDPYFFRSIDCSQNYYKPGTWEEKENIYEEVADYRYWTILDRAFKAWEKFKAVHIVTDLNTYRPDELVIPYIENMKNLTVYFSTTMIERLIFVNGKRALIPGTVLNGVGQEYFFMQEVAEEHVKNLYPIIKEFIQYDALTREMEFDPNYKEKRNG